MPCYSRSSIAQPLPLRPTHTHTHLLQTCSQHKIPEKIPVVLTQYCASDSGHSVTLTSVNFGSKNSPQVYSSSDEHW